MNVDSRGLWYVFTAGFGLAVSILAICAVGGLVHFAPVAPFGPEASTSTGPRDLLCVAPIPERQTVQETLWDGDGHEVFTREVPMDEPVSVLFDY